jgi:uncharacterized protein YigE (DUF2233 family)
MGWVCLAMLSLPLALHAQETNRAAKPSRSFVYYRDEVKTVPWSIHIVKVDRSHTNLVFHTVLGQSNHLGMSLVSTQARFLPPTQGRTLAAMNGDFYYSSRLCTGDPMGLQITQGELISAPALDRSCVWFDAENQPHRGLVLPQLTVTWPGGVVQPIGLNEDLLAIGAVLYTRAVGPLSPARGGTELILERNGTNHWLPLRAGESYTARIRAVQPCNGTTPLTPDTLVLSVGASLNPPPAALKPGAVLTIATRTNPDLKGSQMGIGGGPSLVVAGKVNPVVELRGRNPRSAIGWNKDFVFMVVVDGRQRNISVGMTLAELANYMLKLGCTEALNFDGGGSTTLWVMNQIMNSPSLGAERPAANTLLLVDTTPPKSAPVAKP